MASQNLDGTPPSPVRPGALGCRTLTRRHFIGGACVTLLLAACGSQTEKSPMTAATTNNSATSTPGALASPAATASTAAAPSETTASTGTTRVIQTIHGSVDVPLDPQRIVALDFPEACALLDLGLPIIGKPSYLPDFAPYTDATKDVPAVQDNTGAIDFEQIVALKPDLIVTSDWTDPAKQLTPYDQLSTIAPTAVFEWQQAGGNWRSEADSTAEAVGLTRQMDELKQQYADRCAEIKATYADVLTSTHWDVIDGNEENWDLYSANSSHGRVLVDAGVQLAAGATQTDGYVQYSIERLDMLAESDLLFVNILSKEALSGSAVFTGLPAVKAGHVFYSALYFPASYGIALALLDDVEAACKQLQGGD